MLLNSSSARTNRVDLAERPPRPLMLLAHSILLLPTRNASCFGQAFFEKRLALGPSFSWVPLCSEIDVVDIERSPMNVHRVRVLRAGVAADARGGFRDVCGGWVEDVDVAELAMVAPQL